MSTALLFVPGTPVTQGSKTKGRFGLYDDNAKTLKPWRRQVTQTALDAQLPTLEGPLEADLTIVIPRPRSHFRGGRNAHLLKASAPAYPIGAGVGDSDKYARAIFDALADAGAYGNDTQIVAFTIRKQYTDIEQPEAGAWIYLTDKLTTRSHRTKPPNHSRARIRAGQRHLRDAA